MAGGPSLVIGRDGEAVRPDSQLEGLSPMNAPAVFAVGR